MQRPDPIDKECLLGLVDLMRAFESRDELHKRKALLRIEEAYGDLPADEPKWVLRNMFFPRFPRKKSKLELKFPLAEHQISAVASEFLKESDFVLWWTGKRFVPAFLCHDMAAALSVKALLGIVGGRALLVCPHCTKPFVQARSDQHYCSIRCREAHRVARWRATRLKRKKLGRKRR